MTVLKNSIVAAAGAWLSLVAIPASAAPPAAPVVTTGANIKQLQFDWSIVPRSNYYEVWQKPNNASSYVKFFELKPWEAHATNNISAHLLDWDQVRYQVKACNPAGCSASPDIPVKDRMLESIGYFKAGATYQDAQFGVVATIAEDGQTFAAFAREPVAGNFVNAIYVHAKIDGEWRQQARLEPASPVSGLFNTGHSGKYNTSVALSADGNVLVIGMPFTTRSDSTGRLGMTIYRRSGGAWSLEQQFVSSTYPNPYYAFVQMNDVGDRILYRRDYTAPAQLLEHAANGWHARPDIPQPPSNQSCYEIKLSANGQAIVYGCTDAAGASRVYVARAPSWAFTDSIPVTVPQSFFLAYLGVDTTADTIATTIVSGGEPAPGQDVSNQTILLRKTAGLWQQLPPLRPGAWNPGSSTITFGVSLALSHNGGWLALSDTGDRGAGLGVLTPPLASSTQVTAATYVYELRAEGARLRRVLKPNKEAVGPVSYYGALDFANDGKTLLVAEPYENGGATGVDGDRDDNSVPKAGAVWLY